MSPKLGKKRKIKYPNNKLFLPYFMRDKSWIWKQNIDYFMDTEIISFSNMYS